MALQRGVCIVLLAVMIGANVITCFRDATEIHLYYNPDDGFEVLLAYNPIAYMDNDSDMDLYSGYVGQEDLDEIPPEDDGEEEQQQLPLRTRSATTMQNETREIRCIRRTKSESDIARLR